MLNSRNLNHLKGFTLLEMIISIGIFVLVATASSVLFNQALNAYRYTTSRMAAAREAGLAMEWIVRNIRPDAAGVSSTISTTGGDISNNVAITLVPPLVGNKVYYHRHLADNTIQREELNRVTSVSVREDLLAENVVSLSFAYFNLQNRDLLAWGQDPNGATAVEIIIETQVNGQTFRLYNVANR
jgi:prepilin-type N-terminal cleavage/methylation domain-containing protein